MGIYCVGRIFITVFCREEETMKKFETEHHEMKRKNNACDPYVSNLMGEMQRMEAKKANHDSILKRCKDYNRLKRLALTLNDPFLQINNGSQVEG